MLQFRVLFIVFISVFNFAAFAAEPTVGVRHMLESGDYSWQINDRYNSSFMMFAGESQTPVADYDLSGCMFCEGEDDNCESDGVFEIDLNTKQVEPILGVVCHVGAHSQRFQVLAPWRKTSAPAYVVTGDYYVSFEHTNEGVSVEYDRRNDEGVFQKKIVNWP